MLLLQWTVFFTIHTFATLLQTLSTSTSRNWTSGPDPQGNTMTDIKVETNWPKELWQYGTSAPFTSRWLATQFWTWMQISLIWPPTITWHRPSIYWLLKLVAKYCYINKQEWTLPEDACFDWKWVEKSITHRAHSWVLTLQIYLTLLTQPIISFISGFSSTISPYISHGLLTQHTLLYFDFGTVFPVTTTDPTMSTQGTFSLSVERNTVNRPETSTKCLCKPFFNALQ